jgi:hypothetical protein
MTALGALFEVLVVCGFASLVLAVSFALILLPKRRVLAKQIALATVCGVFCLFAAQGLTTLVVLAVAAFARRVVERLWLDAGEQAAPGLLALATIATITTITTIDGARAGWRIGSGRQVGSVLRESLLVRAIRRSKGR